MKNNKPNFDIKGPGIETYSEGWHNGSPLYFILMIVVSVLSIIWIII